jgi:hypothetical protein
MHTKFRWENPKEKRPLGDLRVDEGKRACNNLRNFYGIRPERLQKTTKAAPFVHSLNTGAARQE